jgi:hypothetical protein
MSHTSLALVKLGKAGDHQATPRGIMRLGDAGFALLQMSELIERKTGGARRNRTCCHWRSGFGRSPQGIDGGEGVKTMVLEPADADDPTSAMKKKTP